MNRLKIVIAIGVAFLFQFCDLQMPNESDYPSWSVNLNIPILNKTVTIDDLIKDSLITKIPYGTSGDSIFAYEDNIEIEEVLVGDKLNIDDITQSISQSVDDVNISGNQESYSIGFDEVGVEPVVKNTSNTIGNIYLDDTESEVTDPVYFTDIVDLSGVSEGANTTIAQSTTVPTIDRQITFDDFDAANFTNGYLEITITNNLVIELGYPVHVRLLNQDLTTIVGTDGDSAIAVWDTGMQTGQSVTRSISLSNKTLPANIIVQITGFICGSGAVDITNNAGTRNSSFVVAVQAKSLEVSSALAVIPEQTIDTTSTIALNAEENNKVRSAVIKDGRLSLNVQNTLPVNSNLMLTINSLKTSASGGTAVFTETVYLPAGQTTSQEFDLANDILEMDLSTQEIEYAYTIQTLSTEPYKVNITSSDMVTVDLNISGDLAGSKITFSAIEGIIEPQDIVESGEINTSSDAQINVAEIASGALSITFVNNINQSASGIPHLVLDFPELLSASNLPVSIESDIPNGLSTINIDLSNYAIQPLSEQINTDSVRQYITYSTHTTTPSGEIASYNLIDSINVNIEMSDMSFSSITGYFNQDAIVNEDAVVLEENTKLSSASISNGDLVLSIVNNIGVIADVEFVIDELVHRTTRQSLTRTVSLSSSSDPVTITIPLDDYDLELPLTDPNANQEIHYTSTINIPSTEEMTITTSQEIDVNMKLSNLKFSSVSGYLDTVRVDIEAVEQEISALPEEISGINLQNVEMLIDFDTNIGVPVELNLVITSYNSAGDSVRKEIQQIITDNPTVVIPDAEELINIIPQRIAASGYALIGGSGAVDTAQYVRGNLSISVPLEMEITEDAGMDFEPSLIAGNDIPKEVVGATLIAQIENGLEIGGNLTLLAARDTLLFESGVNYDPDTLAIINLLPDSTFLETIELDESQIALFQDSLYIKTICNLSGMTDAVGNPVSSRFLSGDELKILVYGTINGLIDLAELEK